MIRLAVIVSDFGAAANIGGTVETTVRLFDLPPEVAAYIEAHREQQWQTVSLALDAREQQPADLGAREESE